MSEGKPAFFSVIIPNYNTEMYIEKCLNALARQSFKDFEVVITDDCSTDNSVSVIQRYKKGGNSGAGSYNHLAEFKAEVLNQFVKEKMLMIFIKIKGQ